MIVLNWSNIPDESEAKVHKWRIYRGLTDVFANAILLDEKSEQTRSYRDNTTAQNTTYFYWITAIDYNGVEGEEIGPKEITNLGHVNFIWFAANAEADLPDIDGILACIGSGETELEACDALGSWVTECDVPGSVVVAIDYTDRVKGVGSIKATILEYPVIREYNDNPTLFDMYLGPPAWDSFLAQSFTIPACAGEWNLGKIRIKAKKSGSPSQPLIGCIYTNAGTGTPGTQMASAAFVGISGTSTSRYATFPTVAATSGVTYWAVIQQDVYDATGFYFISVNPAGSYADGGLAYGDALSALNYDEYDNRDMLFSVYASGDGNGSYVYTTIGATDISALSPYKSYIKSSVLTGGIVAHAFGESNINEQSIAISATAPNVFEQLESDISSIAASSKNAVTKIGYQILSCSDNVLHFDDIRAGDGAATLYFHTDGTYQEVQIGAGNIPINRTTTSEFYDDFLTFGTFSQWSWSAGTPTIVAGNNGVLAVRGDSTTPGDLWPIGTDYGLPYVKTLNPIFECKAAQIGTAAGNRIYGLAGTSASLPTNGIWFQHAVSNVYIGVARIGSVTTSANLAVSAVNGTYHTLKFEVAGGGTSVEFSIDGVSTATLTAGLPTVGLFPYFYGGNNAGSNGINLDYVWIKQDRS